MWLSWLPFAAFLMLGCALVAYVLVFRHRETRRLIAAWADDQKITLRSCRWQLKPFTYWPFSLSMMTYRIKVTDETGRERRGWLLVRDLWYRDRIDVIWDEDLPPR